MIENYETTSEVAARLGITANQVTRLCKRGRFAGAIKPHPNLWLVPRGAVPVPSDRGRPPAWLHQVKD